MESMTATEVRDRLDHRFKLLVRSRRGLERHQTLHHAVAWSYDLLDEPEKALLERCSVFAGGFDVQGASAIAGSDDEFKVLDLLDALVRKSLLVVDRSTGRTRFSMLETIRQFAEEKLVAHGEADEVSSQHARYFASREAEILELWDSPSQREAYEWYATEFVNLRAAFRWAADHADLEVAATIATYAGFIGLGVENFEPLAWAEELIEPARAFDHPRLPDLAVIASLCWMPGRTEAALGYLDIAVSLLNSSTHISPYAMESWLGTVYLNIGQPERAAELFDALLDRRGDSHVALRASKVLFLVFSGEIEKAAAVAEGLIEAGIASNNPYMHTFAASAATSYQLATMDPERGLKDCRQGLALAKDSGNSFMESILAFNLARIEAHDAVTAEALDHLTLVIRNYHDSGNVASLRSPLGTLSSFLDRLGHFEAAATLAGYGLSPSAAAAVPELLSAIAHLREVLGDEAYESLARKGEAMTMAAVVAYAYDEIEQARTHLRRLP